MLRRKITTILEEWGSRPHKCLLVKGQRQVGKTYAIRMFAESRYDDFVEINFAIDRDARKIFSGNLDVDTVVGNISMIYGKEIVPGRTLIFLDEIQECMDAWSSLKPFTMDGRYDVIASGSMLGFTIPHKRGEDIASLAPAGYQESVTMRSMDFEEFLWAVGYDEVSTSRIRDAVSGRRPLGEAVLGRLESLFRTFMSVGGMPESVQRYADTKQIAAASAVLDDIIDVCRTDIQRYNAGVNKSKTAECFEAIPSNLSQTNKRFMYSRIAGEGSRNSAEKYLGNILWIRDSGVGSIVYQLEQPVLPLKGSEIRDVFRIYMSDTGMLVHMFGNEATRAVAEGDGSYNQGAIVENAVCEAIVKSGYVPYYYRKNSGEGRMELDFVIETSSGLAVIEVKSGKDRTAPSMSKALRIFRVDRALKFENSDIYVDADGVEHYPLFASSFLHEIDSAGRP